MPKKRVSVRLRPYLETALFVMMSCHPQVSIGKRHSLRSIQWLYIFLKVGDDPIYTLSRLTRNFQSKLLIDYSCSYMYGLMECEVLWFILCTSNTVAHVSQDIDRLPECFTLPVWEDTLTKKHIL